MSVTKIGSDFDTRGIANGYNSLGGIVHDGVFYGGSVWTDPSKDNSCLVYKWVDPNWVQIGSEISAGTEFTRMHFISDGTNLFLGKSSAGHLDGIWVYNSGGDSWDSFEPAEADAEHGIIAVSGVIYVIAENGIVKKSSGSGWTLHGNDTSGGDLWVGGFLANENVKSVMNNTSNVIKVYKLETGTWSQIGTDISFTGSPGDRAPLLSTNIVSVSDNEIYVTFYNNDNHNIVYKWDGANWSQYLDTIVGLVRAGIIYEDGELYLAGSISNVLNVYKAGDVTWENLSSTIDASGYFTVDFSNGTPSGHGFIVARDAAGNTAGYDMEAPAADPDIDVSPATKDYGTVAINTNNDQIFTVDNNGTGDLTITTIDGLAAPFSIINDNVTGATISPAGSETFTIRYTPTDDGTYSDTATINSDDPDTPAFDITLDGEAIETDISVSPASKDWGDQLVGAVKTQEFTVSNVGDVDLHVTDITGIAPPFSVTDDNVSGATIAPAASETFTVQFAPTSVGVKTDVVTVNSDDPDTPAWNISLDGVSLAATEPREVVANMTTLLSVSSTTSRKVDLSMVANPGIWGEYKDGKIYPITAGVVPVIAKLPITSTMSNDYESNDVKVGRVTTAETVGTQVTLNDKSYTGVIATGDALTVSYADDAHIGKLRKAVSSEKVWANCESFDSTTGILRITIADGSILA